MSSRRPASPPPPPAAEPTTVRCPGCGSVLAASPGDGAAPTAACARLFEETLRGLREDAGADPRAASTVALADDAYAVQHPDGDLQQRLPGLAVRLGEPTPAELPAGAVPVWHTTIADVAADLDVIDLAVLVTAWARAVLADATRTGLAS
ncbi:DUF5946 family protein [Geodermatophilus sp. SYSU D00697]